LACRDQRRLTKNGSALEVVLHDDALYKSTYFTHLEHRLTLCILPPLKNFCSLSRTSQTVTLQCNWFCVFLCYFMHVFCNSLCKALLSTAWAAP